MVNGSKILGKIQAAQGDFPKFSTSELQALNNVTWCQQNPEAVQAFKAAVSRTLDKIFKKS